MSDKEKSLEIFNIDIGSISDEILQPYKLQYDAICSMLGVPKELFGNDKKKKS